MTNAFALVGFSYLGSLLLMSTLGNRFALPLIITGVAGAVIGFLIKSTRKYKVIPLAFASLAIASFSYMITFNLEIKPVQVLDGQEAEIVAQITNLPEKKNDRYYYMLKTESIGFDNAPQNIKIYLSSRNYYCAEPYDKIKLRVKLYSPKDGSGFSSRSYYYSKGVYMNAYSYSYSEPEIEEIQSKPLNYYILKIKSHILSMLRMTLPDGEGDLAIGMLLGDKSGISKATIRNFQRIGTSHLLAVSGIHLTVLTSALIKALRSLRISRAAVSISAILSVLFFMALTSFSPSIMRAGIMTITYLFGDMLGRKSSSVNSLGLALLLQLLINPFSSMDLGLLLSVFATLGIITLSPELNKSFTALADRISYNWIKRIVGWVLPGVSQSLSAILFILPITVIAFDETSLIAPISNLLFVNISSLLLISASLASIISAFGALSFLSYPFAIIAGICSKALIWLSEKLASLPFATISVTPDYVSIWLAGALLVLAYVVACSNKIKMYRLYSLLMVLCSLAGTLSFQVMNRNLYSICVSDVGNGTAVVITNKNRGIVIGCGGVSSAGAVSARLRSQGVKSIDLLIAPRLSSYEASGMSELMSEYDAEVLSVPNEGNYKETISYIDAGDISIGNNKEITIWENVNIKIVSEKDKSYIDVEIGEFKAIIICLPSMDISNLIAENNQYDTVILRENFPSLTETMNSGCFIFSSGSIDSEQNIRQLNSGLNITSTAGNGNVIVQTKGLKGIYKIRRA